MVVLCSYLDLPCVRCRCPRVVSAIVAGLAAFVIGGCKDLTGGQSLPAGTNDPSFYSNSTGAIGMRNAADSLFESAFLQYIIDSGLLSDELEDYQTGVSAGALISSASVVDPLDERILPQMLNASASTSGGYRSYQALQTARGAMNQAIGALATYDSTASPALRGEMYALQGYVEVMLADLFCSGVPLSTLDFQGDFTYHAGSTTQAIYDDAVARFDTAIMLSSDSARIMNLARIGLGRAYLDLGRYADAVQAVESVPVEFQYQIQVQWNTTGSYNQLINAFTVSDGEGGNGLRFISSGDPRTADTTSVKTSQGLQLYFMKKYAAALSGSHYSMITLANGVEARLIQAEAALHSGDASGWLMMLNTLRVTGTADSVSWVDTVGITLPVYGSPGRLLNSVSDTVWNPAHSRITHIYVLETYLRPVWSAGTGGASGLYPITDPMDPQARVDTMFAERAAWLYATGHRQGDLRRLIRQLNREQGLVYPVGVYLAPGQGVYGSDVSAPIPSSENPNPLFHGCLNRDA